MARGRRSAVSPYERRRWLEQLENGKGITEISRAARRDIRVVKRHIDVALEERDVSRARRDFLVGRLERHQQDLLAEVQRLRQAVTVYPPVSFLPDDSVQRKFHEALREHARRLPLKGLLEAYESAAAEYGKTREQVSSQVAKREAALVSSLPRKAALYPWSPALIQALEPGLPLDEFSGHTYSWEKQDGAMYDVYWSAGRLTRSAVSEAEVAAIVNGHKELLSCAERYRPLFKKQRQHVEELAHLVVEELDTCSIKRLVPGRCRYCPL